MKTKKIIISLAILIVTIIIFSSMTVFASVSTRRAYSIGVEHSTGDNHAGDFTYNIDKAASYYGQISSVTGSYYNYNPTKSYLTDDGPDGIRRIGSPIVFLNGHANSGLLTFAQESKGNDYLTGVVKGNDLSSGDYEYVGLSDSDTDLSGVDLITFVGCSTSDGSDNLCETAIDEGATTSVGFYDPITSRNYSGKRWLKYYNRGLKDGKDVEDAVDYATTKAPNSDLGDSAEIHGSETNTILSNSLPFKLVTVAYASSFTDSLHEKLADSSNIDDIEDEPIAHKVNITLSKTALTNNVVDMSASELTVELNKLFEVLVKIDESFNIDDYKVTINMYSKDKGNGMILIRYFINDMIKTNKAYVVSVRNNSISTIYESDAMMIEEVDTNRITAKATTYLSENQKNITTTTKGGDLYKSYMTYDYLNGTLSHFEVVFAIDDVTGVIVPEIKEVVIE